jgi:hypothetical protein
MEEPNPIPNLSEDRGPRQCPECGARVAARAVTCLVCGAVLGEDEEAAHFEEEESPEEPSAPWFRVPWSGLFGGVLAALAFLVAVGWLVRAQMVAISDTPTPSASPTVTLRPSRTPKPTDTPPPAPTFTPVPPRVHQVLSGETCVAVATNYGISLELLEGLNPDKCGPQGIIRPGDLLLIPAATPTAGPTPTLAPGAPSPTPECPILHVVQQGETGIGIAQKYGISFNLLQTANPQINFEQLPVNQVLQVPCAEPSPTPTATPNPYATPTPIPKYMAPMLLAPADGGVLTGDMVALQWTAVSLLRENEYYVVRVRRADEDAPMQSFYTKSTLERLGPELAPDPDDPVRVYTWEVMVVRERPEAGAGQMRYTAASQTSAERTFRWVLDEGATAPATPTP